MLTTFPSLPPHAPHSKPKQLPKLLLTSWSSRASNGNSSGDLNAYYNIYYTDGSVGAGTMNGSAGAIITTGDPAADVVGTVMK